MRLYVLRQVVDWCYFGKRKNVPASYEKYTKLSVGLSIRLFFLSLLICAIADRGPAIAGFVEEQKLVGVGSDSVAIGGNRIVVGSPEEDGTGVVHVYRYDSSTMTWVEEQKLMASDGEGGEEFGFSVAITSTGDRIVVSAPKDNDNGFQSGSIYVFQFDPATMRWLLEQKIIASDGASNDFFGFSTAISDDRIVVGSPLDDDKASRSGAVYVYRLNSGTWVQEQKLVASDGAEEDMLGISVAIEENRIVAGAYRDEHNGIRSGSAYVFGFDSGSGNWAFETKLTPLDGMEADLFGNSVSISADRIVVGTQFSNYAYVFRRDNDTMLWVTEQKLQPSDGVSFSNFGFDVAIAGDQLVVGAPGGNKVYLFEFDGAVGAWVQKQNLIATDASEFDQFGRSVTIAGDLIAVGSQGSAYIFRFTPDSDGDGVPDEQDQCPNSDTRPTVIIGTCDSGIGNILLSEPAGCTITDEIMKLAKGANSHGQFVSQVDNFLLELQKAGILEPNEKTAIKDCAAQSNLP